MSTPRPVPIWNIANVLTIARIVLIPFFAVALVMHSGRDVGLRWLAVGLFAVAVLTDRIDGDLARSRNLITDFGKIMDPIADKLLIGTALVSLSVLGDLPWWVTIVILVREVGITVWRLAVLGKRVIPADRGGKIKTFLQSCAIGLFLFPLFALPGWITVVAWILMGLAVAMTLVSGANYLLSAYRVRTP